MIFCFDALGNTLGTVNERVYQGSSGANTIYFLSPVDENAVVSISARFSNGKTEGPFVMNSLKDRISGLFDKELKAFSVWEKKVDAILTGVSGKVELQFNVTSMSGEVVATKTVNFIVGQIGLIFFHIDRKISMAKFFPFSGILIQINNGITFFDLFR